MLKNFLKILVISFFVFFAFGVRAGKDTINLYFFYGDGCPHCAKEEKFLDKLKEENENIKVNYFEVWHDRDNAKLLGEVIDEMNLNVRGVPVLIIGDEAVNGYYSDATTGVQIKTIIEKYTSEGCPDRVGEIINGPQEATCVHGCDDGDEECVHDCGCSADFSSQETETEKINIPLIGEIDPKKFSIPLLTVIIAAIDGFNPCAMWVLLFLINLLLGMQNRRRMWILGSAFIFASGFVYFLFLSAWLNIFMFLGFIAWIRIAIGVVAMASGAYHLREYKNNKDGTCKVTGSEKRRLIFGKIKNIINLPKLWLAMLGIMLLAGAVNLVELVCSAGLPAVYTQVLALADLPVWQYYGYLILYIFIFMADDLIVFILAMLTLKLHATDSKYALYSNLFGGLIMLILGLLLIFKPGWIMF